MATTKPRITITLDPENYELIKSMSDVSGQTMSRVINGIVEDIQEPLKQTVAVIKAAQNAPKKLRNSILQQYENYGQKIEEAYIEFQEELDLPAASTPPSCNTGVTTTPPSPKTAKVRKLRG